MCSMNIAIRILEAYLISLGVPKYLIRGLRRLRYLCTYSQAIIGGHGKYKCKSKPLIPVRGGLPTSMVLILSAILSYPRSS